MFSLFVGLRYTGARRRNQLVSFISSISITGLVIGVCLLVVVISVLNGFDREMRERVLSMVEQASLRHFDSVENWPQWRERLLEHPSIIGATPFVEITGAAIHRNKINSVSLVGIEPDLEPTVSIIADFIKPEQLTQLASEINTVILGAGLADKLEIEVGERLRMMIPPSTQNSSGWAASKPVILTVIGVFDSGTAVDQQLAITSLTNAQRLASLSDRVTGIKLKLDDLFNAYEVAYSLYPDLPNGFRIRVWTETHGNQYQNIQVSRKILGLLLFLIIAIAVFNVVSTLVMVVVDKQTDVAILRTLGANTRKIMAIFMVQGCLIGVIGTGIGIGLGLLLSYWVTDIVVGLENIFGVQFVKSDVYPTNFLPVDIRLSDVLTIAVISMLLSFVATLYPAWRASRVKPAEALRFDL